MSYLTVTRYGLTHVDPTEMQRASGWRQVWEHPSGLLAMRQPWEGGRWVVAECRDGAWMIDDGWCSSLRAAANRIERIIKSAAQEGTRKS